MNRSRLRAALYARFSTDKQSKDSAADQFRVCERLAEREGFAVAARFSDPGVTGGTAQRPEYQSLLAAARRREFEVVVAEDLKRLWREQAEQWRAIKELLDLGVAIVTASGIDSRQQNFEMLCAVMGAAGELERKEAAYRTRRGLEGRALKQLPTGGRAFGYIAAKDSASGDREIDPVAAAVVREIFAWYAGGKSPRWIASELNERGVASPGAAWNRSPRAGKRADGKWLASSINGGLLANPLYRGEVIWNRVRWERGNADSLKRRAVENPVEEWIRFRAEPLRIVPEELWLAVQTRRAAVRAAAGKIECRRPGGGSYIGRNGKANRYALSGLLKCAVCGRAYVIVDASHYGCGSFTNGGRAACENRWRVRRTEAERAVAETVQRHLVTPEAERLVMARLRVIAAERSAASNGEDARRRARLAAVERELDNIRAAIRAGILTVTTRTDLLAAEAERDRLLAPAPERGETYRVAEDAVPRFREAMRDLAGLFGRDPDRARMLLRRYLGAVRLEPRREGLVGVVEMTLERLTLGAVRPPPQNAGGSGGRNCSFPTTQFRLRVK